MFLPLPIHRLHLLEIDDQPWFPSNLRSYVQAVLTKFWALRLPPLQRAAPATLAARTLQTVLKDSIHSYTFVDFCAGAGGPTPHIEREVNRSLRAYKSSHRALSSGGRAEAEDGDGGVDFILTDLFPHRSAWSAACAASESGRLGYFPAPLDASRASTGTLSLASEGMTSDVKSSGEKGMFRLFSLAFHHFDDELAVKIMRNTLLTSEGFAIFELQGRDLGNLFVVVMMWPLLLAGSWWWFWGEWGHLFWTYVIPVVPFVTVYDGLISCLRTRRENEIMALLKKASGSLDVGLDGWKFETGEQTHTWPTGTVSYFIGVKERE